MRLRAWKSPWRGDGDESTIPLAAEAADYIEAQAVEIAVLPQPQTDALKIAREALRNIQIEAEREQGSWVHLKRVIALNCKQALAALE